MKILWRVKIIFLRFLSEEWFQIKLTFKMCYVYFMPRHIVWYSRSFFFIYSCPMTLKNVDSSGVNMAYVWSGRWSELFFCHASKEWKYETEWGSYISTPSSRTCEEDYMGSFSSLCKQFLKENENRQKQKWKNAVDLIAS